MATIHHQPYHHSTTTTPASSTRRHRRHSLDYSSLPSSSSCSSSTFSTLKHSSITYTNIHHSSRTLTHAISTTTTPTSTASPTAFSLDQLERRLASGDLRQADEETRRMLIVLAGEAAIKRGYVFFSEVQFIAKEDLKAIDDLWRKYSDGKFGYSVQKKLWLKCDKDFTRFFMKVGWMKKLDTEVEQFNYRSFPSEFMWDLNGSNENNNNDDSNNNNNHGVPPEGHLPLTNALRGTQLLNMIFTHPAFDEGDDEANRKENEKFDEGDQVVVGETDKKKSRLESLRDRLFKPNYSF